MYRLLRQGRKHENIISFWWQNNAQKVQIQMKFPVYSISRPILLSTSLSGRKTNWACITEVSSQQDYIRTGRVKALFLTLQGYFNQTNGPHPFLNFIDFSELFLISEIIGQKNIHYYVTDRIPLQCNWEKQMLNTIKQSLYSNPYLWIPYEFP